MYKLLESYLALQESIDKSQAEEISRLFHLRCTQRNEILLSVGDICRQLYFVNQGCLRIYLTDEKGREFTRWLMPEGRFGTAFPSFILQEPSAAFIQCIEPCELLAINHKNFTKLLTSMPGFETLYRLDVERSFISSIKRIESLITMKTNERYISFAKENPGLVKRLPAKIIADYLGMSKETLSRLKSKMLFDDKSQLP